MPKKVIRQPLSTVGILLITMQGFMMSQHYVTPEVVSIDLPAPDFEVHTILAPGKRSRSQVLAASWQLEQSLQLAAELQ